MADLAARIEAAIDHERDGLHVEDYRRAVDAVLNLCEREPSSLIDTDDLLEVIASGLGVLEDPEG